MKQVIVFGDSFNNTLGLIRSLGEAKVNIILILVGDTDRLFVAKSRYLQENQIFRISHLIESLKILDKVYDRTKQQYIICSNDKAALFIDNHEEDLSKRFITPMRGKHLGNLFNKDSQCKLADECGLTIPKSFVYRIGQSFPDSTVYPLLLKPLNSNTGEKSDIHICRNHIEVEKNLALHSACTSFIVQEFIEKEYEINLIGVRTDLGMFIPGGIRKIRHYPTIYSPCSFGLFQSVGDLNIDIKPIESLMNKIDYYGPFSVEFLHKGDNNYFMEVNFRHDGLAYSATAANCNLLDLYINDLSPLKKVKNTYMMDLSTDYCYVKEKKIKFLAWLVDFLKTECQLNFNRKDPMPTIYYYVHKLKMKFSL